MKKNLVQFNQKNENLKSMCPIVSIVRVESLKEFTRKDNGEKFYKMKLSIVAREGAEYKVCDGVFPCTFNAVDGIDAPFVGEVAYVTVRPWYDFANGYKIRYAVNFFHPTGYAEKYNDKDAENLALVIQEYIS